MTRVLLLFVKFLIGKWKEIVKGKLLEIAMIIRVILPAVLFGCHLAFGIFGAMVWIIPDMEHKIIEDTSVIWLPMLFRYTTMSLLVYPGMLLIGYIREEWEEFKNNYLRDIARRL